MAGNYRSNRNTIGKSASGAISSIITQKNNERQTKERHERSKVLEGVKHKNKLEQISAQGKQERRTATHKGKVGVKAQVKVSEARTKEIKARTSLVRASNKSKTVTKKTPTKRGTKK